MRLKTTENTPAMRHTATAPVASPAPWPDALTFREALQHPDACLADATLQNSTVALSSLGLPLTYTGRSAVVFRLTSRTGQRLALRCFTSARHGPSLARRYRLLAPRLSALPQHFVPFTYEGRGIRLGSAFYPTVTLAWAEGETLGHFVEAHVRDAPALLCLRASLVAMLSALEAAGIAHGDWQHDNLVVADSGKRVTLVDYDGCFVPELSGEAAVELGHGSYQHPRRTQAQFGLGLDRFACLSMETALLALAREPSLWARFADGESLLFKRADYANPDSSPVFAAVREAGERAGDGDLLCCLARLESACLAGEAGVLMGGERLPLPLTPLSQESAPEVAATAAIRSGANTPWWLAAKNESEVSADAVWADRLKTADFLKQERKALWVIRLFPLIHVFLLFILFSPSLHVHRGGGGWPNHYINLMNPFLIPLLVYLTSKASWPRQKILLELKKNIDNIREAIYQRRITIYKGRFAAECLRQHNQANWNRAAFIAWAAQSVSVAEVTALPWGSASLAASLNAKRIYRLSDLTGRIIADGFTNTQIQHVDQWYLDIVIEN